MDLAILDVMLPDGDGFSMCQEIRKNHLFPIIMLTAKDHESDKIIGLTFGADDYITKPFRPLELIARVKAQLRRSTRYNTELSETDNLLVHRGLAINVKTHEAILDGIPMNLTPTEFLILKILCEENGNVVSSEQLFHRIWGDEYFVKNNNTITTHIRHLREKLGDSVENPKYIKTVWGVGYKLEK
jgi:two-component system response regulator VanR